MKWNDGKLRAVMNNKLLSPEQRRTQVWDIERGYTDRIEPYPWQTCTCLGSWHYNRSIYERRHYKSAQIVIHMLTDIVSKNGNLLLSVPLRGDGTFDSEAEKTLYGIRDWMAINREGIVATRPWEVFGEGPAIKETAPLQGQGFNEGRGLPMSAQDVRYTVSKDGKTLYAIVMGRPETAVTFDAVRVAQPAVGAKVTLLGYSGDIAYRVDGAGRLTLLWPASVPDDSHYEIACAFKLSGFDFSLNPLFAPNAVVLKAEQAVLHGREIRAEQRNDRVNIGYWNNRTDSAHWLLKIPEAGTYQFRGEFAAMDASRMRIQADDKEVAFRVPRTGGWDATASVDMGAIRFDRPGVYHLQLSPDSGSTYRPVNLWQIQCLKQ